MEHFCTLFDIGFLPQGVSLHASLQRYAQPFTLWVLCMDEAAAAALERLALPGVRCIRLRDIETPRILAVKPGRSRVEYCWTMTPFLPEAVMNIDPGVQRVTYVDADCWFTNDPRMILKELDASGKDFLITPHDYLPQYDQSKTSGIFCIQFVPVKRSKAGLEILTWWQERCLEWCFNRFENGLFGDQKYFDRLPKLFPTSVHVLKNTRLTLAPWNIDRYKNVPDLKQDSCLYHFHNLRIFQKKTVSLSVGVHYNLPKNALKALYQHYLQDLAGALHQAEKAGITVPFPPHSYGNIETLTKDFLRALLFNRWIAWRLTKLE